jgi:pimeloyl-ACP methyl ester carboxylesterase
MTRVQEQRFDTGQVVLNYAEGPPNGRPFVVLHGGAGRWQHGQEFVETMSTTWHVFAPDLRGHGKSSHVAQSYHLRDYVPDIVSFLTAVVREPAVIYGHSLGGEVAVMLAAQHPHLPRAVIVGDAPLSTREHGTEEPTHRAQNILWHSLCGRPEAEIAQALRQTPVRVPGEAEPRLARDFHGEDSPWFAHQATSLHQLDPDMLAAVLAGPEVMLEGYVPEVLLPKITCPVLLLQADPSLDNVLPNDQVELALRLLPNASHVRLDGTGHPLHAPPGGTRVVMNAIAPFLDSLERVDRSPRPGAPDWR